MLPFVAETLTLTRSTSETPDFAGPWRNQRGSGMELVVSAASLTGTYRTAVGEPRPGEAFDLVGFVNGDLIAFTVDFGAYGSVAAWAGIMAGADTFTRVRAGGSFPYGGEG